MADIRVNIACGLAGALAAGFSVFFLMSDAAYKQKLKSDADQAQAVADAVTLAAKQTAESEDVSHKIDDLIAASQSKREATDRTIIKEVPRYVTANTDRAFAIAVGLVRVRDAAASGDVSKLGGSPGVDNDSTSGVSPSAFAAVIADDYAAGRDAFEKLDGCQAYVKEQYAIFHKPVSK